MMLDPSGSSAHVTHNLCNYLARAGCEVHVFTAPHWQRVVGNSETHYQTHICFSRGTQMRSYDSRRKLAGVFWRVARLVQHVRAMILLCRDSRNFDVVHTQILPLPLFDYFCLRQIARRTPIVCTVHELVPHQSKYRRLAGAAFAALYRLASVLYVFTDYTGARLIERGLEPGKLMRVPHGSLEHLPKMQSARVSNEKNQRPIILFAGNIRPDKGVDTLIEAASYLREKISDFAVQVAGTPTFDVSGLQSRTHELNLDDVIGFHFGYLSEEEFATRIMQATVVVLPYRRIEQSGVALAACTMGKAIVATRCGGLEELITEAKNGLLVPVDDARALADALATLLLDPARRRECEINSARYAREALSWPAIAAKTIAGYKMALATLGKTAPEIVPQQS